MLHKINGNILQVINGKVISRKRRCLAKNIMPEVINGLLIPSYTQHLTHYRKIYTVLFLEYKLIRVSKYNMVNHHIFVDQKLISKRYIFYSPDTKS